MMKKRNKTFEELEREELNKLQYEDKEKRAKAEARDKFKLAKEKGLYVYSITDKQLEKYRSTQGKGTKDKYARFKKKGKSNYKAPFQKTKLGDQLNARTTGDDYTGGSLRNTVMGGTPRQTQSNLRRMLGL